MCTADTGGADGGVDAAGGDAHVPCNGMCSMPTPRCLATGSTETCVGCTRDGDCAMPTSHCEPTSHTCVACLNMAQCTTAGAARCDTTAHVCAACTGNGDCTHLTGTSICNMGTCVGCTATDLTGCASGVCLTSTSTCAPAGGAMFACGACAHDADCQPGQLCVPMTYGAMAVGTFCAWRLDATGMGGPAGDCLNVRPYRISAMVTSTDGVSAMVCQPGSSTCDALSHFQMTCSGVMAPMSNPTCGAHASGFCQHQGAVTQCIVECSRNEDCPCNGGACLRQYQCNGGFCNLTATCNWDAAMHTCH